MNMYEKTTCIVTTGAGKKNALSIIVVGHAALEAPALVEDEAARLAAGDCSGPRTVLCEGTAYLLVKPESKEWLVGGEEWRLLGKQIVESMRSGGYMNARVSVDTTTEYAQALVEGCVLADYRLLQYRSGKAGKRKCLNITMPGHKQAVKNGMLVAEAQNLARTCADMPGNDMNPQTFVTTARKELRGLGLKIKVISGIEALTKAGFPGLVQVGKGSAVPPALVQVSYTPTAKTKKNAPHLALVGKGVTFDTGGISLKPGAGMWEMKGDMGGAAATLGAIKIIAQQKPSVAVTAYMALAENMPDGAAQRPGDIYQARNGTFIHVDNTDAEGRLVLADVLTYACEQGATHMVNSATLTGACLIGLGNNIAGVMSRNSDEAWRDSVRQAGQSVGEELWPLPLYGEYRSQIDHPHADINNTGGRPAGTITAGLFLAEFVADNVQWAHCDIAGPAMRSNGWRYYTKGMTGFVTRTFARIAQDLAARG